MCCEVKLTSHMWRSKNKLRPNPQQGGMEEKYNLVCYGDTTLLHQLWQLSRVGLVSTSRESTTQH